jgi:ribosomal protein S13
MPPGASATIAAVSRRDAASRSKRDKLRAVPWIVLAQAGVAISRRWRSLSEKERARLTQLARESRGRPGNLSAKQRAELRRLVGKLDLRGIPRELGPLARRGRGRGRRGRSRACK